MFYIGIDLGTTNIKAAAYDDDMRLISRRSLPVEYVRSGKNVEFDAEEYFGSIISLLDGLGVSGECRLSFTGQAETLVCLGADGRPLTGAISWMDERSQEECTLLSGLFDPDRIRAVTGQAAMLPTWPATKILWLRRNRPDIFSRCTHYVLLKDYIVYKFTGVLKADMSIATFSLYFDIYNKRYWPEMLGAIGVNESQLPPLAEPCTDAGCVLPGVAARIGIDAGSIVNIGTLDHFAGMTGTGNIAPGTLTLSTGTVMALAAIAGSAPSDSAAGSATRSPATVSDAANSGCPSAPGSATADPAAGSVHIAMHYGFIPGTYVMLPVAESGGVSLEWLRRSCLAGVSYDEINSVLESRPATDIIFLPYITGTNAPEFDAEATGVFWGLRGEHDAYDMARAVMEGVAFVLRKNCEAIKKAGTELRSIIATGGGSKSPLWCQIQADITGIPVCVPEESEAACLGSAMIAAVSDGRFDSLESAAEHCVRIARRFEPSADYDLKFARFNRLYEASLEVAK